MGRHKVDAVDLKILAELQADGRITNVELAERANITAPPSLRRVRALEKAGLIRGYHADLEPKALGYELTAFAFVGLSSQAESDLRAFEEEVRSWPLVRECNMLSGEIDFILRCVAHDLTEFQTFVTEQLTAAKNVASVKTALSIRTSKHEPGVPIDTELKARQVIDAG
jgi:DNA-binding Lrp family transcriptional regulator